LLKTLPTWLSVIALDLALTAPDRVASLVLAEPAVHMTTHPRASLLAMGARATFHRYLRRDPGAAALAMYRWASSYTSGGSAFDAFPEPWREQMLAHARSTLTEMDQMLRPYPSRRAIRSITCPVTVIAGELSEPSFAAANAFILRLLPQARLVSLTDAAHMLHVDQPPTVDPSRHPSGRGITRTRSSHPSHPAATIHPAAPHVVFRN
jgi:pimeloyl-ACP methyl ester carboxylesterase